MKNSASIAIGYEDVLFFNKNKDYGAYIIRIAYKKNLSYAMLTAMTIFALAVSYPLLNKSEKHSTIPGFIATNVVLGDFLPDIKSNHPVDLETLKSLRAITKFLPPKVARDEDPNTEIIPTQNDLKNVVIGTINQKGINTGPDLSEIQIPVEKETPVEIIDKEYHWVEEMPRYKSDESEIYKFFAENIKYPEIAKRAGVEGRVVLGFIIAKDGSITNISVLKGIGAGCDEEAERVLALMGKWSPGRQNGNPVRVVMSIPIMFKLKQ
jgi:periplasmic protein TonB